MSPGRGGHGHRFEGRPIGLESPSPVPTRNLQQTGQPLGGSSTCAERCVIGICYREFETVPRLKAKMRRGRVAHLSSSQSALRANSHRPHPGPNALAGFRRPGPLPESSAAPMHSGSALYLHPLPDANDSDAGCATSILSLPLLLPFLLPLGVTSQQLVRLSFELLVASDSHSGSEIPLVALSSRSRTHSLSLLDDE